MTSWLARTIRQGCRSSASRAIAYARVRSGWSATPVAVALARYASSRSASSRCSPSASAVRPLGDGHRPGHLVQPPQVGLELGRGLGHRAEQLDVGHRVPGGRVDPAYALGGEVPQRGLPGLQLGAAVLGPPDQGGRLAPARAAHDQVALEGGGVDLQRPEQAAHVAAAGGLVGDLLESAGEPGLLTGGLLLGRPGRLEGDLVADPFHLGPQLPDPLGDLGAGDLQAQPDPQ